MSQKGFRSFICSIFFLVAPLLIIISYNVSQYDRPEKTRTILDRNGQVIGTLYPLYNGYQVWTPLESIPSPLIKSLLTKEDRFFYRHPGINPVATLKALLENIRRGKIVRGGSTITQQLAKNLITQKEGRGPRTFGWKIKETILAVGLELKHSKKTILEKYLNTTYFGNRCYGIAAAANFYFGKKLDGLNFEEIDYLTSLPKNPGRGKVYRTKTGKRNYARHFVEWVTQQDQSQSPQIKTSLDLELQKKIEDNFQDMMELRALEDPKINGAVIVIDVLTGELLAMIGSRDYFNKEIDGSVNASVALRQPGSALKPFTYFAAFSKGYLPETEIWDIPTSFNSGGVASTAYIPQNFDRTFHGSVSIKEALANSYNIPAVITLNEIGLSYYHDILKKFGFTTLTEPYSHYGLSVTLGSGEVTLLELTNAYAVLARGGDSILPNAEIYAQMVTRILSDPKARLKTFGWNEAMTIEGIETAVKTGTSYDLRDNWTIGTNDQYAVGVWIGHSDGSPLEGTTGATGAAPVWHAVMETLRGFEKADFSASGFKEKRFSTILTNGLQNKIGEKTSEFFGPAQKMNGFSENPEAEKSAFEQTKTWRVVSPLPNTRYRVNPFIPKEHQKIPIKIEVGAWHAIPLQWKSYLDGEVVDWIEGKKGSHELYVEASDGSHQTVFFHVLEE